MEIKVYRMVFPDRVCGSGEKVVAYLTAANLPFEDLPLRSPEAMAAFKAQWQVETTPQIFIDGERIGGWEALLAHPQLGKRPPKPRLPIPMPPSLRSLARRPWWRGPRGWGCRDLWGWPWRCWLPSNLPISKPLPSNLLSTMRSPSGFVPTARSTRCWNWDWGWVFWPAGGPSALASARWCWGRSAPIRWWMRSTSGKNPSPVPAWAATAGPRWVW
ncbi:MAG: hypothetical protein HC918_08320 [Oscillatoriales cyanobacterium SM2_1_8]|nr:hypothetical protein [Oscillatoriales cyanobacterium SM2_1_8]